MGFVDDFKRFILRGNVMDLAIGFTVGAAFSTIVKSLVDDLIMPPIAYLMGTVNFQDKFLVLKTGSNLTNDIVPPYTTLAAAKADSAITMNYGQFINGFIALMIVAVAMFMFVNIVNSIDRRMESRFSKHKPTGHKEPSTKKCAYCLSTIPFKAIRCPQCTSNLEEEMKREA